MNLQEEILEIKRELVKMGSFVEENIRRTFEALEKKDFSLLNEVLGNEQKTNDMEKEIEDRALRILITHAPKAKDFRVVTAILKIITDLERMGDHTEDICEIAYEIDFDSIDFPFPLLEKMFQQVEKMLNRALDAFITGNIKDLEKFDLLDDVVDEIFLELRRKIIDKIKEGEKPEIQLDLVQIGKYVERMGDHTENIAEWVVYEKTGLHPDLKKGDRDDLYSGR